MVSTAKSFPFPIRESATAGNATWTATNACVLDEFHFVRMLRVERKRTERSGDPFMLMLLSGAELLNGDGVLNDIVSAVAGSTRETDTLGWYEKGAVLGILFTELGTTERAAIERIVSKVTSALSKSLDEEQAEKLAVTYHVFPEDVGAKSGDHSVDVRLYPDLDRRASQKKAAHGAKRVLDVLGSLAAIALFAPIFLFVAAVIKLTSKGPVLFRQERIGQYGAPFTFLKFRSMRTGNDPKIHQEYVKKLIAGSNDVNQSEGKDTTFKLVNDPRVTPIGRFLRRTSLDELPQFFNVLRGDMSLVGPRPPVRYEYEAYDIWHRRRVVEVKPGITGLWQVKGRSRTTFDEMVRLDLQYAQSWTVGMDVRILLQTPKAVISGNGAY